MIKRAGRALLGPGQYDEIDVVRRVLPDPGFMVDVGAHWGLALAPFADRGWRVLALEPDPSNRRHLESVPRPTVTIDDRAVTETDGQQLTLFTSEVSTGISSLVAFHESHRPTVDVATVRLDTLLREHGAPHVDFLKVDTEGFDLRVLETFPWDLDQPSVVVCEFEDSKTEHLGYDHRDLADFLVDQGYDVLVSEWYPIEEYGRQHRWRRLMPYPAALATPDAWGNFIATRPEHTAAVARAARWAGRRLRSRHAVERLLRRG